MTGNATICAPNGTCYCASGDHYKRRHRYKHPVQSTYLYSSNSRNSDSILFLVHPNYNWTYSSGSWVRSGSAGWVKGWFHNYHLCLLPTSPEQQTKR